MSTGSRQRVASVARALALLDEVARSDAGLGVNELARRIGVNASTASRLLGTLEDGGLVERSPDGPYRLGLKLVALSDRVLGQLDVRDRARPWLTWLVKETGETATLSVPGGGAAITVDFVPSPSSVVSMARLGRPSVAHATAAGKVMLAFGSPAVDGGVPGELVAFTDRTITDTAVLARELDAARVAGVAEAVGEREPDLNALAAPVIGRGGELIAILGLQGPARGCSRAPGAPCERRCAGPRPSSDARSADRDRIFGMLGARGRFGSKDFRGLADEELMELVRGGEVQAFEVIFDRHSAAAFSLAYRMCGRRSAAEDIVQDAFLSLWRSSSGYDAGRGSVRSWVLSVVHNRAIDVFRHGSRHGRDVQEQHSSVEGVCGRTAEDWPS